MATQEHKTQKKNEKEKITNRIIIINNIIDNNINSSMIHRYSNARDPLYRFWWYGFDADDETLEPAEHFPMNKVLFYYKSKYILMPNMIDQADHGSQKINPSSIFYPFNKVAHPHELNTPCIIP